MAQWYESAGQTPCVRQGHRHSRVFRSQRWGSTPPLGFFFHTFEVDHSNLGQAFFLYALLFFSFLFSFITPYHLPGVTLPLLVTKLTNRCLEALQTLYLPKLYASQKQPIHLHNRLWHMIALRVQSCVNTRVVLAVRSSLTLHYPFCRFPPPTTLYPRIVTVSLFLSDRSRKVADIAATTVVIRAMFLIKLESQEWVRAHLDLEAEGYEP
ncbi:hypothetical protein F5Y09DRAFT_222309 [Xylaria sp. FL1042]|nr:hypothetical protein F5Y09DRAFT_222309 [Xylaria sp. FL1042]